MSRSPHAPVTALRLHRTVLTSALCLCAFGVIACGGSARSPTAIATTARAETSSEAPLATFYCLPPADTLLPSERHFLAEVGVVPGLCAATDATWALVVRAIEGLTPVVRSALYDSSDATSFHAESPAAGAALAVTDGVLTGAARRAIPTPPSARVKVRTPPNPVITSLIRDTLDPSSDPPCLPEPTGGQGRSAAGESIVRAATAASLRHASVRGVLLAIGHELAADQFCDRFRELLEQLRRAYSAVTDPALVDRLVAAQASAEGLDGVPPAGGAAYAALRKRAIRDYILSGQLTEAELQSGGQAAENAALLMVHLAGPRGPGDSALRDEEVDAESRIDADIR